MQRRFPVGAELRDGGAHFRVWAPGRRVELLIESPGPSRCLPMTAAEDGYHELQVSGVAAEARYRFRLDGGPARPDPASRFQPEGVHGPSEIVDPASYAWGDSEWRGIALRGQVIYEMHVGTFTPPGTFAAALAELPGLAELGVTTIEVMPVAEFDGRFGWGYDGVDLFASTRLYGRPDDFRRFVDRAHQLGMAVILDVVYNHFGPSGCYWGEFSPDYFSRKHSTDWGQAINFDGENSPQVREFFLANAGYWIDEYHLDGLRLDAVHSIVDDSPEHILAGIAREVRRAAAGRRTIVVAENESQEARLLRRTADGGYGLDAAWSDDFHHVARVAATGHNDYYYGDYQGTAQELVSAVKHGFLYQGQWNRRQQRRRGTSAKGVLPEQFVFFLQNHDQIANSAQGLRLHALTSPGRYRALTALLLLAPQTPLLFQGQEFAASSPFLFFADHAVDLAKLVRQGRGDFLRQFHGLSGPDAEGLLPDPADPQTFERSKLDLAERQKNRSAYRLHRDLLQLRRTDAVFSSQGTVDGAVLAAEVLLLRFEHEEAVRLLVCNLGRDLLPQPLSEPLAAPPENGQWRLLWSSEDPRYGGSGSGQFDSRSWRLPGHAALVLASP